MVTFNEAMLSNDRTLAIRVGDFTSENIKSANFKYGYITGDDFTPGGTYAGTASILFTSIVESFKKLDVVYPEIGLLVGSKVEWIKMGKYYIDDIKIDRNANTTEIELMDEMFKLNESFKTDLKYPAQIRDVILEIATKTGVTLASDNFGTTAIQQHVDEPTGDKLTYRDVLSQASQLLGFSCFFNRNGELEVRGLTESGITITADNYFLHGLEKSEVEYQIAGITCETKDDEVLTVGLQTGRSLEIENPLATQDTLNSLYYTLKDIVYYPYDLSYQGHLKLEVGQWVTIKTNKNETFKVPVLYQSFSFSGGLTSTISADSVAGNDAQYTYGNFVTKKIDQKSTRIQAEVQQQLKYADEEFKKVSNEMLQQSLEYQNSVRNELATSKAEIETQIDTAKTQAESSAKAYADEINQATAEVAEQANTTANSLKSDLAKVKTDLTATTSTANAAKTSASEAKQQLTTVADDLSKAKTDLQNAVSAVDAKATALGSALTKTKSDITAQAKKQTELTTRVTNVETTANGTKTTVTQLSKTVDNLTGDVSTAKQSIKKVEDDVSGVYTTLSTLTVGGGNLLSDTTDFSMGKWQYTVGNSVDSNAYSIIDGAFHVDSTIAVWHQYQTYSPEGSSSTRKAVSTALANLKAGQPYILSFEARCLSGEATIWVELRENLTTGTNPARIASHGFAITEDWVRYSFGTDSLVIDKNHDFWRVILGYDKIGSVEFRKVKLEEATVASPWTPAYSDSSIELAEYKQGVSSQLTSLSRKTETLENTLESNKVEIETTVNGIKTDISELQAYKDDEGVRAESYLTASRNETAKQITAERTNTSKNYVAKSTYTSDVTGLRNDLTATTTTANTTKTNLANYQASNDKAVANLQSNLQTANGNISSLQTKVEAVPGQISSAVSAVEGKIPTSVSTRNLILKSNDFANPHKQNGNNTTVTSTDDYFVIKSTGYTANAWGGMSWNMSISEVKAGEEFSILMPVYIDSSIDLDSDVYFQLKNHPKNLTAYSYLIPKTQKDKWFNVAITFKTTKDVVFDTYPFYVYLVKNGLVRIKPPMLVRGNLIPSDYQPAFEDTESDITKLSSELTQTKDGMTLLATKTELNTAKSDLQSGITTATNKANTAQSTADSAVTKANAAQSTADNNAKTISTHTTQISALNTGLSAKVSQTDFNMLSGRVTSAENNITAKANELSSKISSVEGQIPTTAGGRNYALKTGDSKSSTGGKLYDLSSAFDDIADDATLIIEFDWSVTAPTSTSKFRINRVITYSDGTANQWNNTILINNSSSDIATASTSGHYSGTFKKIKYNSTAVSSRYLNLNQTTASGTVTISNLSVRIGSLRSDWQPAPEDYDSKLASAQSEIKQTTDLIKASVSSVQTTASNAQATANTAVSKADAAQAGVNTLDNTTVKSASLTINTDGIVMKAGKSTTDVANAIGSYFAVNQNAINLFSDKINVKANMIVDGAITSTKIASKTINTAHLNGKIITADVISSNAVTADAIKAGAVTTDKMTANSINGDRITAGTLDAAKIKAGSITASQIASGTITSSQIKSGTIVGTNIAAGAITTNHLAAGSITADKIAANAIDVSKISGNVATFVTNAINSATTNTLNITNEYISVYRKTESTSNTVRISPKSIVYYNEKTNGVSNNPQISSTYDKIVISSLAIGDTSTSADSGLALATSTMNNNVINYGNDMLKIQRRSYAETDLSSTVSFVISEDPYNRKKMVIFPAKGNISNPNYGLNTTGYIQFNLDGSIELKVKNIYYTGELKKVTKFPN